MYRNTCDKPALLETLLSAVLNSYSVVFFLNNKVLSIMLLLVSFLDFWAGLSGLLAVLLSVALAQVMGLDKQLLKNGVWTFNALLTGLCMGTFFHPGPMYFVLLATATFLSLLLSASFGGWLFKNGLPFLSLPFILTFWIVALSSDAFAGVGLTHPAFFWTTTNHGKELELLHFTQLPEIYLRSLSSILFQNNLLAGALIAIGLLFASRIMFAISWMTLLVAWGLTSIMGAENAHFTYYNVGANYMMIAFAAAGFFTIPSKSSMLWAILLITVTSLIIIFLSKLLVLIQLPLFSLPFALVTIGSVNLLNLRTHPRKLIQTPLQLYSPESNLYTHQNNLGRYTRFNYFPLSLPFWGEWTVSQGYDGDYTHQGDWKHGLDFMILDHDGKAFSHYGTLCEDYHCYGKPVLAPGDGIVEEVIDQIDDNEIGQVNTVQNWGNSIVIKHLPGVYTQLSHLRKGSVKVSKGAFVKRGDVLAACGNSGRSPIPHLHFQVQATPYVGSKTLHYPMSYYSKKGDEYTDIQEFSVPIQQDLVGNVTPNRMLRNAFDIQPNTVLNFWYTNEQGMELNEHWEAFTDAYNYKYLYCKEKQTVAYYYCDHGMFYFTAFYGSRNSLLYAFYLTAYKVNLNDLEAESADELPLNLLTDNWLTRAVNDLIAPFSNKVKVRYASRRTKSSPESMQVQSHVELRFGRRCKTVCTSSLSVRNDALESFTYSNGKTNLTARCER